MTTLASLAGAPWPKTMAERLRTACAATLLPLLMLLMLPVGVQAADYTYTINNGRITITKYTGPGGAVTIPDIIEGLPVTGIGEYAFGSLTGVTSVTIGNSVTIIGDWAFFSCTSLTSLTIGNSVTSIGELAFGGCTSLRAIEVDGLNPAFSSVEGVLFNKSRTTLIACPGVKGGSYTIPDSVTSIEKKAFEDCTSLTSVTIGNSVTIIGDWAFFRCTSLTSLTIGNSVSTIGGCAFNSCTSLTSVTIPDSVTSIGGSAFSGCHSLTNITIPSSVTSIGAWAFSSCTSLTSVTIPDSVTSIGESAFSSCTSLRAIEVDGLNPAFSSAEGVLFNKSRTTLIACPGGKGGSYTIPNGVISIGESAFSSCTSLTSVTIPDSVTSIGGSAFSSCTSLRSVYFQGNAPSTVGEYIDVFPGGTPAIVYYLPGMTGWGPTFSGHLTVLGHGAAVLEIALYPGIRVTGEVGTTYAIESKAEVEGDFWLTRGWIELTTPTAMWMDPVPTDSPRKVYRAVKVTKPVVQTVANMVWIAPGTFVMGSPETERGRQPWEGPQTRVTLTKGFWMGKNEVTLGEYLALMGEPPCYDPENPSDLDRPVVCVSWDEAVAYCQKLTEQERAAGRVPAGYEYRLPTEVQWEYACRAGTTTRFSFGDALECDDGWCPLLDSYSFMWWFSNPVGKTSRVGQKLANPWGLYDMHGNVGEWCQDWWGEWLPGGSVTDPEGLESGSDRVYRDGYFGCCCGAKCNRSAARNGYDPVFRSNGIGFRVLLAPGQ